MVRTAIGMASGYGQRSDPPGAYHHEGARGTGYGSDHHDGPYGCRETLRNRGWPGIAPVARNSPDPAGDCTVQVRRLGHLTKECPLPAYPKHRGR